MDIANETLGTLLDRIQEHATRGEPVALVRVVYRPSGPVTLAMVREGSIDPPVSDPALTELILASVRRTLDSGGVADLVESQDGKGIAVTIAIEVIKPKLELLVFGGGHVGQAVASIGAVVGYDVTVVDDRPEFASRERLPDHRIRLVATGYETVGSAVTISPNTAVVIVTRGHQYDELCLKTVLNSPANYIGMIGSRRRVYSVFKKLVSEGFPEDALQQVHAPIGLQIGARSPQEIAVAILAEIISDANNPAPREKGD